ncbi:hypothetical protein KFK09_012019 [Dendrobium nobile]|uniref:Uncharacterized protein n=1 Tax=Dendrobium nobile TaxID=94219 RepID=A0A8T3BE47_DENNO|nr:hypothetical protein KFK09_012019 [Dendrobium nobile]
MSLLANQTHHMTRVAPFTLHAYACDSARPSARSSAQALLPARQAHPGDPASSAATPCAIACSSLLAPPAARTITDNLHGCSFVLAAHLTSDPALLASLPSVDPDNLPELIS